MKRISILLIMLMVMFVPLAMNGQSTTVTASRITSANATWTGSTGETWNVTITGGALNQAVTNGYAQFGTRQNPSTSGRFSTSGISMTITSIAVDCASYSGLGTVSVTVGGDAFGSSQSIPNWSNNAGGTRTFTGSASGNIVVTMTNGNNGRAMYIKSITVTYTSGNCTKTIPYTYGFEDATDYNNCWTNSNLETCSNNNGMGGGIFTSSSYAHNGTHLFIFSSYCGETDPQYLISPELSGVVNGVHVEFNFAIVSFAQGAPETFKVGYSTTDNNLSSFNWTGLITCTSSTYEHYSANFIGQVKYIAVQYTSADSYYLFLDDFIFEEAPNCLEPTNVVASNETTTSATISWTAGGSEAEWDLYYTSNPSDVPTASTTPSVSGITTNSHNLTSLTPATTYHAYVRSACSSTETSAWSNPCIFNTECYEMALPYSYGFEDGTLSVCWTPINANPVYMSIEISNSNPRTGTYHLNLDRRTPDGTQIIVLPEVDETYALSNYEISFYAMLSNGGNSGYTTTGRTLTIGVMTDPDDESTFVAVGNAVTPTSSYVQYTFDLSSYTGNGQYIAIKHDESSSGNNGYTYIDDLQITALPCPVPSGLSATPNASTASLSWTGYQSSYNVRYRTVSLGKPTTTTENFEHNGSMPDGWTKLDLGDGNNTSELGVYYNNSVTHAGDYCFRFSSYAGSSSGSFDQYLISPELNNLSALSFFYRSSSTSTSGETFRVGYSTTTNDVSAFTWVSNGTTSSTSYSQFSASNIPANAKYFAINYTAVYQYRLYIDDITYTYTPIIVGTWNTSNTNVTSPLTINGLTQNTDYEWQVQGLDCDGNGTPTDWSANAYFTTLDGFTVTATADPTGSGTFAFTGSGVASSDANSANVNPNGDVTITATAAAGYTFMNWAEGGTVVSTSNAYTITAVDASHNLTAHFVDMTASNTWPAAVTTLAAATPGYSESGNNITISNANGLAWLISTVNGLNGQSTVLSDKTITLTDDVDMSDHAWVPIGTTERPFTCTFDGNGHIIKGVTCSTEFQHKGLFGYVSGAANIQNVVVQAELTGNSLTTGAIAGTFASTGTISNVEGGGTLTGGTLTTSMGGLVGNNTGGTIHSSFAVNTITSANATTQVGGLVGNNTGDLLNCYANATISGTGQVGGLVGTNTGTVENCYSVIGSQTFPSFAYLNNGTVKLCYAENGVDNYVGSTGTGTLTGHGNFTATEPTHTYGYMYWDNTVTVAEGQINACVVDTIKYTDTQIDRWPGLLSTLEYWVESINNNTEVLPDITFTKWLRPTTKYINDDLPVLCFPKDNCLITIDSEGKALRYGPFDGKSHSAYMSREVRDGSDGFGNQGFGQEPHDTTEGGGDEPGNGVDGLLEDYENMSGYLFVYDNAIDVERVPGEDLYVFINEDVAFKQAEGAGEFINTQVGVSFDNSCGTATDFFGNTLAYDWHMLSTPLADAALGISYNNESINYWDGEDLGNQVTSVANSYLPDGIGNVANWDFYSFYEPEYHWINLKRNSASHHHYDAPYDHIVYENEDTLVAGKGYMAAIKKDSYLCNTGTLNGPANPVSITLTKLSHEPGIEELGYNLLGNPYQAYLDVNKFLGDNNLSSYWVYIAESDNYVAGNADASENPALPSATLHPHQGFFVLANSDGQTVNFDYDKMALTEPVSESYFRGDKVNYPLVNLFATSEKGKKDLTVIEFNRPEFGGSYKMRAINNADFELSAYANNSRYSILFIEKGTEKVPVHFRTNEAGTFTMTWSTYHGNFTSLFLVDNLTGTRTDMLRNDHYTFNGTPNDYDARFYITFKCTGVEEYIETEEDFAWYNGNEWVINGNGTLQVIDMLGRVLMTRRVETSSYGVSTNNLAAGVYMMRLINENKTKVQKIIVK